MTAINVNKGQIFVNKNLKKILRVRWTEVLKIFVKNNQEAENKWTDWEKMMKMGGTCFKETGEKCGKNDAALESTE